MKKENLLEFLENKSINCLRRRAELWKDDRRDEADFEKVKANVYDIFKTVLSVVDKEAFLRKLTQIPSAWENAYVQAERRGDAERMHIEKLKLDAVAEIKAAAAQWEGEA